MRFWDSSSLVAFLVEEEPSQSCRDLYRADPEIMVWALARHETWGGICRKRRDGIVPGAKLDVLYGRLTRFAASWHVVSDWDRVRALVDGLLRVHDLRTADALQLAAALAWAEGRPRGRQFVSGDDRLLAAAAAAGFTTIRPESS